MINLGRDCIFYNADTKNLSDKLSNMYTEDFQEIRFSKRDEIAEFYLCWVDPIRVMNKIIAKEKREVFFRIYRDKEIFCCFSDSESNVNYAKSLLLEKANINLIRKPLFEEIITHLLLGEVFFANLISIHLVKRPTGYDNSTIRKVNVVTESDRNIFELLNSDDLLSVTCGTKENDIHFYVDKSSVVYFPDTTNDREVEYVVKKIVEEVI